MTGLPPNISRLAVDEPGEIAQAPTLVPNSPEEVAAVLRHASEKGLAVEVRGGGTRSGYGSPPAADIVLSTAGLSSIEAWEPDDLTLVIEAGANVDSIESTLAEHNQTAVLPENAGASTIGGVIAAGASGYKRSRLYGTRERVLEATVVTGDGRIVRGGGRVVKNVTGYDLPRLMVGAFGSLGVIVSLCLKLWPAPPHRATVQVDAPEAAGAVARPLAVLEDNDGTKVFVWGTEAEVDAQARKLGGSRVEGHDWPGDPMDSFRWSLRLPPASTSEGVDRLPEAWRFVALHGVGEIRCSSPDHEGASDLRRWAESLGGRLVVVAAPPESDFDPWGEPPPALEIQRRLIAQFDPARVINPGRLPGGL